MSDELANALRYRNYAEELRVIAADRISPQNRERLLHVASDYDLMAANLEALDRSRKALGKHSEPYRRKRG